MRAIRKLVLNQTLSERLRKLAQERVQIETLMIKKVKSPLIRLYEKSRTTVGKNTVHQFDDLYHLLCNQNVLLQALGNINRSKGSLTPGINPNDTVDAISLERIDKIILQLKAKTYKFSPVRRISVPKPGTKKLRPLGIPTFSDKLVQEALRMILEAIYEPIFEELRIMDLDQKKVLTLLWRSSK